MKDTGVCFLPASILRGSLPGRPLSSIPTCGPQVAFPYAILSGVAAQLTQEAVISASSQAHPCPVCGLSPAPSVWGWVGVMGPE